MLTAKMMGMTPAWLTRRGRNVAPPWYMRRPRTRLAYWMGMRRWPSWMYTMAATAPMPRMANAMPAPRSGVRRKSATPLGMRGHDAREDDEADAVADAALGDELTDPHHEDGARHERDDHGHRLEVGEVEVRDDRDAAAALGWPAG